jgi:hypothetical protein
VSGHIDDRLSLTQTRKQQRERSKRTYVSKSLAQTLERKDAAAMSVSFKQATVRKLIRDSCDRANCREEHTTIKLDASSRIETNMEQHTFHM